MGRNKNQNKYQMFTTKVLIAALALASTQAVKLHNSIAQGSADENTGSSSASLSGGLGTFAQIAQDSTGDNAGTSSASLSGGLGTFAQIAQAVNEASRMDFGG